MCGIIAMANLAAHAHSREGVDHGNCLYINKDGAYTGTGTACQGECLLLGVFKKNIIIFKGEFENRTS